MSSMSSLLPLTSNLILDGPEGTLHYHPECVPPARAAAWFATLLGAVPWTSERRRMYDREVDVPRLTAGFALDRTAACDDRLDDDAARQVLIAAAALAARQCACAFTSVGLNLYRDGNDSVAPHNDKLHSIERGAPIALLSLGATRRMTITSKAKPRRHLQLDLEPGSLLVMSYATQLHFDHGIPKSATPVGPRISLAFRRRPASARAQRGATSIAGD